MTILQEDMNNIIKQSSPKTLPKRRRARMSADPHEPGMLDVCILGEKPAQNIVDRLNLLPISVFQNCSVDRDYFYEHWKDIAAVIIRYEYEGEAWLLEQMQFLKNYTFPVVLIAASTLSRGQAVKCYEEGVSLILPDRKSLVDIPRFISGFIRNGLSMTPSKTKNLADAVKFRVSLEPHFANDSLKMIENRGIVEISGSVNSTWKWQYLSEIVGNIPGVIGVKNTNLILFAHPLQNGHICELVWNKIQANHRVPEEALLVSSVGGRATISGTVSRANDLVPTCDVLDQETELKEIKDSIIVSRLYQEDCLKRAVHIHDRLDDISDMKQLRVSVCGSVVCLSGYIDNEIMANRIVGRCLTGDSVRYVLNTCVIIDCDYSYTNITD